MNTSATVSSWIDTFHPGTAIVTLESHVFDIMNPSTWVFDISDIATALSNICRFGGHVESHYSVAEHSVRVSQWLRAQEAPQHVQLLGLLHDATEAYVGDIPSPIKKVLQVDGEPFAEFEHSMFYALLAAFGLNCPHVDELYAQVKEADHAVYLEERAARPHPGRMYPMLARREFLRTFEELWVEQ